MSSVHWIKITAITGMFGLFLSLSSNTILLFMMTLKASPVRGVYKRILIYFCCFTIFYSLVEAFLRPLLHIDDNTLFVIQQKVFRMESWASRLTTTMYCGCYAMSFVLFALQFLYRYVATCKPQYAEYFQGSRFFFWIFGAIGIALSWEAAAYVLFPQSPRTQQSFLRIIRDSYDLDPEYTDYIPYRYFEIDNNGTMKVITLNIIGIIQHIVLMAWSFGTLFFCACTTYSTIIKHKGMSAKTRELQMQLFRALVVQATIPMVFMYCPLLFLYLCPLFNLQLGALANYQTIMGQLYPGIDPFAVLFLVATYRRTLINWLCLKTSSTRSSVVINEASQNHHDTTPRGIRPKSPTAYVVVN